MVLLHKVADHEQLHEQPDHDVLLRVDATTVVHAGALFVGLEFESAVMEMKKREKGCVSVGQARGSS